MTAAKKCVIHDKKTLLFLLLGIEPSWPKRSQQLGMVTLVTIEIWRRANHWSRNRSCFALHFSFGAGAQRRRGSSCCDVPSTAHFAAVHAWLALCCFEWFQYMTSHESWLKAALDHKFVSNQPVFRSSRTGKILSSPLLKTCKIFILFKGHALFNVPKIP